MKLLRNILLGLLSAAVFCSVPVAASPFEQAYFQTIHFAELEPLLQPKEDVVVAVIDSGVFLDHEEFQNHLWINEDEIADDDIDNDNNGYIDDVYGFNFLNNSSDMTPQSLHGTGVAGIIAAESNNGLGIDGIARKAKIMSLIARKSDTTCDIGSVIQAIQYAADNGAKVINLSLGGSGASDFFGIFDYAIQHAYSKGAVIITAAGNGDPDTHEGYNLDLFPQSPVCNDNGENMVLGVGATVLDGSSRALWSNYGQCVDLFVPGENIALLTNYTNSYIVGDGTSFAAPIISGLAAEILSSYPTLTNKQIYDPFLKSTNSTVTDGRLLAQFIQNITEPDAQDTIEPLIVKTDAEIAPYTQLSLKELNYFQDVPSSHKYATAINYLKKNNIVSGYSSTLFKPSQKVTRAEMLKILIKGGLGIEPGQDYAQACFTDINADEWHSPYVCYAKAMGWAAGYTDGTFRPHQTVNKVEALKFLVAINNVQLLDVDMNFQDVQKHSWYEPYIKAAHALGILEEENGTLGVGQKQTRGQIAEQIFRLIVLQALGEERYDQHLIAELK